MSKYTPIYEKDGKQFICPSEDQVGDTEYESLKVALGTGLVEGVLLGFKFSGKHLELDDDMRATIEGTWATLGSWRVVILEAVPA